MVAVGVEREELILHAALRDDVAVGDAKFVNQSVCVNVVESVACWDIRGFMLENSSQIGVFAVEIQQIGGKPALLQHVAGTSQVVDPTAGLLRPCFVAVEPLSERTECEPRSLSNQRLMRRFVNHKPI